MSNKLIGVSPPPLGQALDSKVDLKKDLKEASSGQYKNDFEKALKEKLAAKEKAEASPPKEKEVRSVRKDESERKVGRESDKEEKESSGGTKKRMDEKVDDQMISMLMASNESEVEIPESKNDLAEIEENQPKEIGIAPTGFAIQPQADIAAKAFVEAQPAVETAQPAQASVPVEAAGFSALSDVEVPAEAQVRGKNLSPEMMQKLQNLQQQVAEAPAESKAEQKLASEIQQIRGSFEPVQAKPKATSDDREEFYIQPQILPEQPMMEALPPTPQVPAQAVDKAVSAEPGQVVAQSIPAAEVAATPLMEAAVAAPALASIFKSDKGSKVAKDFDLEKDLSEEVGFEPAAEANVARADSKEKPVSLKAQEFQKSVYEQLQKMDQRAQAASMQSPHVNRDSKNEVKHEDMASQSAPQLDPMKPNELQHVGQTQSEFKSHLAAPTFAGSEQQRAQMLEQNHEKNIQEVMNQAQYLVKQGGGEMKVSMSPDGLAEVQLKVLLQDGKVHIELGTQDKAVKKLMEDSLTELKSGLAAQNLNLEHVKISSVSATNTDNSAQFQSNWNQSGSEHQQREYWNQFQDNLNQRQNFSKRSNYGASPGNSSVGNAAAATGSVERAEAVPRTYGGTKGSQINWVA